MSFCVKWLSAAGAQELFFSGADAEVKALAEVVDLFEHGFIAGIWQELPIKLTAKARIVKRQSSNAPKETTTVAPPPVVVPSEAEGSVCASPDCEEPASQPPFCKQHFIKGVSPETAKALRKSKGEPRAAAQEK